MFPSTSARRLALLIRRTAAAAGAGAVAGGTNLLQSQAARLPLRCFSSTALEGTLDPDTASSGLSPAALASRGRRVRSTAKADAVLALLRRHDFSDDDIGRALCSTTNLLLLDPDKVLGPNLEFFAALGVHAAVLARVDVLGRSLDKQIVPCVEFLRGILDTDASIRDAVSRNPSILELDIENQSRPTVEVLRRHGLTDKAISALLAIKSGVLSMPPDRIACIFEDIEVLGLPIADSRFLMWFGWMCKCKLSREIIWRRLALYQCFGLSKNQVVTAFMIQPSIFGVPDKAIKRKLLFFQNELKIPLSEVIARPQTLAFNLEKNILPRCAVLSVLMRLEKIPRDINLLGPLGASEKVFSQYYVKNYEKDVPDVVRAYKGKIKFIGFF